MAGGKREGGRGRASSPREREREEEGEGEGEETYCSGAAAAADVVSGAVPPAERVLRADAAVGFKLFKFVLIERPENRGRCQQQNG